MERAEAIERQAVRLLSVVKYQIEATAKNGEKWQSPTIDQREAKTNDRQFIYYCKTFLFVNPRYDNAKSIKIVKIYDYMNGEHIERETIYTEQR